MTGRRSRRPFDRAARLAPRRAPPGPPASPIAWMCSWKPTRVERGDRLGELGRLPHRHARSCRGRRRTARASRPVPFSMTPSAKNFTVRGRARPAAARLVRLAALELRDLVAPARRVGAQREVAAYGQPAARRRGEVGSTSRGASAASCTQVMPARGQQRRRRGQRLAPSRPASAPGRGRSTRSHGGPLPQRAERRPVRASRDVAGRGSGVRAVDAGPTQRLGVDPPRGSRADRSTTGRSATSVVQPARVEQAAGRERRVVGPARHPLALGCAPGPRAGRRPRVPDRRPRAHRRPCQLEPPEAGARARHRTTRAARRPPGRSCASRSAADPGRRRPGRR